MPEGEEESQKQIIVAADAAKKSLPRATTTAIATIGKRKKQRQKQQQKEPTITNVSKQLEQQATEIKKIKSMVQSQPGLIKQTPIPIKAATKTDFTNSKICNKAEGEEEEIVFTGL